MSASLVLSDVPGLFLHCLSLSLLAVGGGMTIIPEFHRYLVGEQGWLSDSQFTSSVALAQSAPGPNVLFVALLGWNSGFNGGGYALALLCAFISMLGLLIPSTTLTLAITRWMHRNRELRIIHAFKQGMAPMVVALLFAAAWLLGSAYGNPATDWRLWLLAALAFVLLWKTKIHLLWMLAAGALLGGMGWL